MTSSPVETLAPFILRSAVRLRSVPLMRAEPRLC